VLASWQLHLRHPKLKAGKMGKLATGNQQPATPVTSNQQPATSNTNQQLATTNRRPQAKPPRVGQGNPIQSETQIEQHIMIIMEMPATRLSSYASAQQQQYRIYICTTHLGTSLLVYIHMYIHMYLRPYIRTEISL